MKVWRGGWPLGLRLALRVRRYVWRYGEGCWGLSCGGDGNVLSRRRWR